MAWLRMDDSFYDHPKLSSLCSDSSRWAFVKSAGYCARHLTDGRVPSTELHGGKAVHNELIASGLWHPIEGGILVHDYLDWNPTADEVRSQREKDSRRKAGGIRAESGRNPQRIHPSRTRT